MPTRHPNAECHDPDAVARASSGVCPDSPPQTTRTNAFEQAELPDTQDAHEEMERDTADIAPIPPSLKPHGEAVRGPANANIRDQAEAPYGDGRTTE